MTTHVATEVRFIVLGPPVPKERPRVSGRGRTPDRTRAYERHVGICALAARQALRETWPVDGCLYAIELRIFEAPRQRGDVDNYLKSILDGCQGVLYGNDRRIKSASVTVDVDRDTPRAEVRIGIIA